MKLYIMRHGPAEDDSSSGRDDDRALSAAGRERVRGVARALTSFDEAPVAIVSSPLVRALSTAEIVAASTKLADRGGSVEVRRELAPRGESVALMYTLEEAGKRRCMVVGHEPDLSELVAALVGEPLPVPIDKAMVVGLSLKGRVAALRFVLEPRTLGMVIDLRAG